MYDSNNFIDLTSKESIIIKDSNGKIKYTLSPINIYYYIDGDDIVIQIDSSREVRIKFQNNSNALQAIRKLDNKVKATKEYLSPSGNTYFTKAESESRFVNVTGDNMTGHLNVFNNVGISQNLRVTGDTYIYGNLYFSGGTGAVTSLADLTDTTISGVTENDILLYTGAT